MFKESETVQPWGQNDHFKKLVNRAKRNHDYQYLMSMTSDTLSLFVGMLSTLQVPVEKWRVNQ